MVMTKQLPQLGRKIAGNARRHFVWAGFVLAFITGSMWAASQVTSLDIGGGASNAAAASSSQTASGYGFSTSFDGLSATAINQKLTAIKATGATWLRYDLSWDSVQAGGPSSYDWSESDAITTAAEAHGLKVLMIIDFVPAWAREADCTDSKMCGPAEASTYGRFAAAAVSRYKPMGVEDWEIWNEPNISYRFHPAADPQLYVAMLKSAYVDIKAVDPNATVIAASTAPSASDGADYTPSDFLRAMYADGADGYFDAISTHPYTYPETPDESNPADAWGQLATMHSIMVNHGDGDKQIWITEFGAPTDGPNVPGDHVSEAIQAQIVTQAIDDFHQMSWSGPFFWYDYQDDGTSTDDSQNFFGLVRANGSFKPSYYAFERAVAKYSK